MQAFYRYSWWLHFWRTISISCWLSTIYAFDRQEHPLQTVGQHLQQRQHHRLSRLGPPAPPRRDGYHRGHKLSHEGPNPLLIPHSSPQGHPRSKKTGGHRNRRFFLLSPTRPVAISNRRISSMIAPAATTLSTPGVLAPRLVVTRCTANNLAEREWVRTHCKAYPLRPCPAGTALAIRICSRRTSCRTRGQSMVSQVSGGGGVGASVDRSTVICFLPLSGVLQVLLPGLTRPTWAYPAHYHWHWLLRSSPCCAP